MLQNAFVFLINTIFSLLTIVLLLRFFMQWFRAPFQNPLSQMTIALTDFIVKPARKWIPSWKKVDLSTLFLALMVQLVLQVLLLALRGFPFALAGGGAWVNIVLLALMGVLRSSIDIFFYALLLQAILSWVNPVSPIAGVLDALTRPILTPIRKVIPAVNGLDFSVLVAMILLQMVNIAFVSYLETNLHAAF